MGIGLIIFLLILGGYIFLILFLNAKTRPGKDKLPENLVPIGRSVKYVGIVILGAIILATGIVAVGIIFFRDEWLPR